MAISPETESKNSENAESQVNLVTVNVNMHPTDTGARVIDQLISQILKSLNFIKTSKLGKRITNNDITKEELLYIQNQMDKMKKMAHRLTSKGHG